MSNHPEINKGAIVTYRVRRSLFSAIVRVVHRDGTATVETQFELRNGKPYGCYYGYRYRMNASDLTLS